MVHHMAGILDQERRGEEVQIAVRKEDKILAGIEAAGGSQEVLGQRLGEAEEDRGEGDSGEQFPSQVPA